MKETFNILVICHKVLYYFYEASNELKDNKDLLIALEKVIRLYDINNKYIKSMQKIHNALIEKNKGKNIYVEEILALLNALIEDELLTVKYLPKRNALIELQNIIINHSDYHINYEIFDKADELKQHFTKLIKEL